ncbi:taste receptor type 2 member 43-like [Pseudophryne corroboree]|uniref:taste receptor type 2 member 43-like n=1 Tax=Pseudophryne corroboree TaxID=495146 RepID=UPI0030819AED
MTEDMNSTMGEEYNIQHLAIHVAAGITFTAGLMINGFIVAVNVTDWMKQRSVTSTDQILTSLAVTRVFFQSACLLHIFLHYLFIEISIILNIIMYYIFAVSFYTSIWLANLLSVVFCLKICNFHNVFFLRLKIMILQRVVHLIIACVLVPICYSSTYFMIFTIEIPKNSANKSNNWEIDDKAVLVFLLWDIVLFLMFFVSTVLLISSLCHHVNRMRCDRAVPGQLDTYYKTIKFSATSFLIYAFYFIAYMTTWFYKGSLDDVGINFSLSVLPTLHSMYLIYVTARLRCRLFTIVQHGAKRWI